MILTLFFWTFYFLINFQFSTTYEAHLFYLLNVHLDVRYHIVQNSYHVVFIWEGIAEKRQATQLKARGFQIDNAPTRIPL